MREAGGGQTGGGGGKVGGGGESGGGGEVGGGCWGWRMEGRSKAERAAEGKDGWPEAEDWEAVSPRRGTRVRGEGADAGVGLGLGFMDVFGPNWARLCWAAYLILKKNGIQNLLGQNNGNRLEKGLH